MSQTLRLPQLLMRRPNLRDLPPLEIPHGVTLRAAKSEDGPALAALLQAAFPEITWTPEKARQSLLEDPCVPATFVIADDATGALLATASVQLQAGKAHTGTVHWVGADPAQVGKGLGYLATLAVLHEMARLGRADADLSTDDFRSPAIKTYSKLGFVPAFTHASHWERWGKLRETLGASVVAPPVIAPLSAAVRVRTYELDSFGHVNNSAYLNYIEEARSEYLKQLGLSFHDFARLGVQLVIVESHVSYLSSARYGDEIEIRGSFRDVRHASLIIDYVLTEKNTGYRIADAWTRGAFVSAATGKPVRAPEPFRAAFAAVSSPAENRTA